MCLPSMARLTSGFPYSMCPCVWTPSYCHSLNECCHERWFCSNRVLGFLFSLNAHHAMSVSTTTWKVLRDKCAFTVFFKPEGLLLVQKGANAGGR
jgi:hypothetical protein